MLRRAVVDSTQAVAFALAAEGAADGTAVVADFQTAGRGRRGRTWEAAPGSALLLSVLLRPHLPVARLGLLSLTTAVAVAEAVQAVAGIEVRLKWPNDVRVGERKVAGVLLEARHGAELVVVAGIGVNVRPEAVPPSLAAHATSLVDAAGHAVDREALLDAILAGLDAWRGRLASEGFAPVRARWLGLSDTVGRPVRRDGLEGVARGLDDDGALLVETAAGLHHLRTGELEAGPGGPLR